VFVAPGIRRGKQSGGVGGSDSQLRRSQVKAVGLGWALVTLCRATKLKF
jgi:hypothetical protein